MIMRVFDDSNYIHKELDYHKKKKLSAVPLNVAPERRTTRCSLAWRSLLEPNFRYLSPGSEGEKCRPPKPFETPFHPLGSICNIEQVLYISFTSQFLWDAQVCI